jgi:hypothetical protein
MNIRQTACNWQTIDLRIASALMTGHTIAHETRPVATIGKTAFQPGIESDVGTAIKRFGDARIE